MQYRVNDRCIGCGQCADICPAVFSMTVDGTACAIEEDVADSDRETAAQAKESCPVEAIEEA